MARHFVVALATLVLLAIGGITLFAVLSQEEPKYLSQTCVCAYVIASAGCPLLAALLLYVLRRRGPAASLYLVGSLVYFLAAAVCAACLGPSALLTRVPLFLGALAFVLSLSARGEGSAGTSTARVMRGLLGVAYLCFGGYAAYALALLSRARQQDPQAPLAAIGLCSAVFFSLGAYLMISTMWLRVPLYTAGVEQLPRTERLAHLAAMRAKRAGYLTWYLLGVAVSVAAQALPVLSRAPVLCVGIALYLVSVDLLLETMRMTGTEAGNLFCLFVALCVPLLGFLVLLLADFHLWNFIKMERALAEHGPTGGYGDGGPRRARL